MTAPAMTDTERHGLVERAWDRIHGSRDAGRVNALLAGDWEGAYRTRSEADYWLAVFLAGGFGHDAAMIKKAMLDSDLARDKWTQHRTYLDTTIRRALVLARRRGPYPVPTQRALPAWDSEEAQRPAAEIEPLRLLTPEELADPSLLKVPDAVGPWLTWRGELTYFPGREKLGKSTLAASDARGVAQAGGRFLWATAEESRGRVVKRLRDLGIPLGAMLVPDRWPRSWEEVEALVAAHRPDAVYVDSLASFLAAVGERIPDTSEGEAWHGLMIRFKRWAALGGANAGVCVFEHATKEDGGFRGSTGKAAAPDTIVTMREAAGDPTARRLDVVGRWGFPSRAVRFLGDAAGYEEVAPGRPGETDENVARVIAAYEPGISVKAWREATGLPETTFYRARSGAMDRRDDGTWGVRPGF